MTPESRIPNPAPLDEFDAIVAGLEFDIDFDVDPFTEGSPVIKELGGTALSDAIANRVSIVDSYMQPQVEEIGLAPLTAQNIEDEVDSLNGVFAAQERAAEEWATRQQVVHAAHAQEEEKQTRRLIDEGEANEKKKVTPTPRILSRRKKTTTLPRRSSARTKSRSSLQNH